MKIENWNGYNIRFIEYKGEWYAVLKDICDALGLKTFKVSQRLDTRMLERVPIEMDFNYDILSKNNVVKKPRSSKGVVKKTQWMLTVNEAGIYEVLFASRKLEARKFRIWASDILKRLRSYVGLKPYEVMRMTEPEIQAQIDNVLDTLYFDAETGVLMQSVTIVGGDVEQVPFFKECKDI